MLCAKIAQHAQAFSHCYFFRVCTIIAVVWNMFWKTETIFHPRVWFLFEKKSTSEFIWKHPKLFCLYFSNQISLKGHFVFKTNGKISSIPSYKDHCCSFFTSWVIKQQKRCILNILKKTPNFGRTVRTLDCAENLKFCLGQFSQLR